MAYNKPKGDVLYFMPNKNSKGFQKKPFAYSTKATSDLIVLLSQKYDTIEEVYDMINYDEDAKNILKKYIEEGFGKEISRRYFK